MNKLQSKNNRVNKETYAYNSMGLFLKRLRLENNLTLEELSNSYLAVSLLSRIENGGCPPNLDFALIVFNKFNIDFNEYLKFKANSPYTNVLRLYSSRNIVELNDYIRAIIGKNIFSKEEKNLIITFDNILKGIYEQSLLELKDYLENLKNYSKEEILFIRYLNVLYYYKIKDYVNAFDYINALRSEDIEGTLFQQAIYDISLSVYLNIGGMLNYIVVSSAEECIKTSTFSTIKFLCDDIRLLYIKYRYNCRKFLEKLSLYDKNMLESYKAEIDELTFKAAYLSEDYSVLESMLFSDDLTAYKLCIGMSKIKHRSYKYHERVVELYKNYKFKKGEELYQSICEGYYCIHTEIKCREALSIFTDVAYNLLNNKFDKFIFDIIYEDLFKLSYVFNKYKDYTMISHELKKLTDKFNRYR